MAKCEFSVKINTEYNVQIWVRLNNAYNAAVPKNRKLFTGHGLSIETVPASGNPVISESPMSAMVIHKFHSLWINQKKKKVIGRRNSK